MAPSAIPRPVDRMPGIGGAADADQRSVEPGCEAPRDPEPKSRRPSSSCATMSASGNRAGARQVHALGSSFDASKSVRTWDCSQDVSENAVLHLKCFRAVVLVVTRSHCGDEVEARQYADRLTTPSKGP